MGDSTDALTKNFVDARQDAIIGLHTLTLRKLADNRGAVSVLTGAAAALLIGTKPDFCGTRTRAAPRASTCTSSSACPSPPPAAPTCSVRLWPRSK